MIRLRIVTALALGLGLLRLGLNVPEIIKKEKKSSEMENSEKKGVEERDKRERKKRIKKKKKVMAFLDRKCVV